MGRAGARLSGRLDARRKTWIEAERQKLERALARLAPARQHDQRRRADAMNALAQRWRWRLAEAGTERGRRSQEIGRVALRLSGAAQRLLRTRKVEAANLMQVFGAVNYRAVLARGYALALDADDNALKGVEPARAAGAFILRFGDGDLPVSATGEPAKPAPGKPARKPRKAAPSEPSLF